MARRSIPIPARPRLAHAAEIRRRGIFAEVACCFWKEEPSMRDALFFFQSPEIKEVYVVPNFISEGYFTQTVIPRELELSGPRYGADNWADLEILSAGRQPSRDDGTAAERARAKWPRACRKRRRASSSWVTARA